MQKIDRKVIGSEVCPVICPDQAEAETWRQQAEVIWASDLPKSLAETAQITLTAEIDSRGGKTAGNQISNFQKSKSNSITTNTIPRATKEFLT